MQKCCSRISQNLRFSDFKFFVSVRLSIAAPNKWKSVEIGLNRVSRDVLVMIFIMKIHEFWLIGAFLRQKVEYFFHLDAAYLGRASLSLSA